MAGVVWTGASPLASNSVHPLVSAGELPLIGLLASPGAPSDPDILFNLDLEHTNLVRAPDWPILISNIVEMRRQNLPGPEIFANFVASNAQIMPTLGRTLAAGPAATVTVNLVKPGTMYGPRLNQLDLRLARALRVGRTKATLNLDIYNALNVDTVLTLNNAFATWQRPQSIILARFAKIGVQFDF